MDFASMDLFIAISFACVFFYFIEKKAVLAGRYLAVSVYKDHPEHSQPYHNHFKIKSDRRINKRHQPYDINCPSDRYINPLNPFYDD